MWDLKDEVVRRLSRMGGIKNVVSHLYHQDKADFLSVTARLDPGGKYISQVVSLDRWDNPNTEWTRRPREAVIQEVLDFYKQALAEAEWMDLMEVIKERLEQLKPVEAAKVTVTYDTMLGRPCLKVAVKTVIGKILDRQLVLEDLADASMFDRMGYKKEIVRTIIREFVERLVLDGI